MPADQRWEIDTTRDLANALEWIRRRAAKGRGGEALLLVAIRRDDIAFAAPMGISPGAAVAMLEQQLPTVLETMIKVREGAGYAANDGTMGGDRRKGDAWEG